MFFLQIFLVFSLKLPERCESSHDHRFGILISSITIVFPLKYLFYLYFYCSLSAYLINLVKSIYMNFSSLFIRSNSFISLWTKFPSVPFSFFVHSLHCSPNIFGLFKYRKLRCADHVARMDAFKIVTGKPTEKRPLGRSSSRWKDNVKMDF